MATQVEEKRKEPRKFRRGVRVSAVLEGDKAVWFRDFMEQIDRWLGGSKHSMYSSAEVPLTVGDGGFAVRVMDSSRVSMLDFKLDKYCFEELDVSPLEKRVRLLNLPQTVGVSLSDLLYALESVSKDDKVALNFEVLKETWSVWERVERRKPEHCPKCGLETRYNRLPSEKRGKKGDLFKCQCGWRGKVRRWSRKERVVHGSLNSNSKLTVAIKCENEEKFEVRLLEGEVCDAPIPKFDFKAMVKLDAVQFRKGLERLKRAGDSVKLEASDRGLTVRAEGDNVKAEFKAERGSTMLIDVSCIQKAEAFYSLGMLLDMVPKKNVAEAITLNFTSDMPLKLSFIPMVGANVNFWLAPILASR